MNSLHPTAILVTSLLLTCASSGFAQTIPKGYILPDDTDSPNHLYGVTVPKREDEDSLKRPQNNLVVRKSGAVLATIHAETGWDHQNHGGVLPSRWSPDSSLLLWSVDGKWSPSALVLLQLEKDKVLWQLDILQTAQQAILARTKKANPAKYAAAKKANAGNGSAYPEGFTVDVQATGEVSLPMHVKAFLTSNPKEIQDLPDLNLHLDGVIDATGKFSVTIFQLDKDHSNHF